MAKQVNINFLKLSSELDEIINKLQSGDVDIDESLKLYGQGREIIEKLQAYLKTAENKVTKVKKRFNK